MPRGQGSRGGRGRGRSNGARRGVGRRFGVTHDSVAAATAGAKGRKEARKLLLRWFEENVAGWSEGREYNVLVRTREIASLDSDVRQLDGLADTLARIKDLPPGEKFAYGLVEISPPNYKAYMDTVQIAARHFENGVLCVAIAKAGAPFDTNALKQVPVYLGMQDVRVDVQERAHNWLVVIDRE